MNKFDIEFAPLQGVTDAVYRKIFSEHFQGVSKFFTPFENADSKQLKNSYYAKRFSVPELSGRAVIPQLISNDADLFLEKADFLKKNGFSHININMGCPYSTVMKKGRGAGMLENLSILENFLNDVTSKIDMQLSVKIRSGIRYSDEIEQITNLLNKYKLEEVIIHPRTAEQKYDGKPDIDAFIKAAEISKNSLSYNGDIKTLDDIENLISIFTKNDIDASIMIGRGLIVNPFLAEEYLFGEISDDIKSIRIKDFIFALSEAYSEFLSGDSHFLAKIKEFWSYQAYYFPEGRKIFKKVKKCISKEKYNQVLSDIF